MGTQREESSSVAFFLSTPSCVVLFVHSCVNNPSVLFSGVFTPFHGSREAAPSIPSLFTLLFSSIYSVLRRPGAPRSEQLFHYGESRRFNRTALPHSSL